MLQMRFLGEPEVLRDGVAVPLPASKKSRERLCELLWDGPDDPRAALRWSLTKLRPVVVPHLVAGREHVELVCEGADVDIRELCTLGNATTGQLIECESLLRGEFAERLDLPGCFRFQQWCAGERERFRQQHVAILSEIIERLASEERAIPFARRHVQIDPFSETAHATLIRLLAAHGNRHEALQQYGHCRNVFERELGARPGAMVEDARRAIGSDSRAAEPAGLSDRRDGLSTTTDFVGRMIEIATIESSSKPVLIAGEPGIGKSRLLDQIRRRTNGLSLYGRAYAAEMSRPYGVWIDALRDFPNETDRSHLFDAVAVELRDVDLLAIDDLQWIDEASAVLLHYVARKTGTRIVGTARTGEVIDNAYAVRLSREFVQIPLGPLAREETLALVAASPDRERVVEDSRGNPLFALELARSERGGTLMQVIAARLAQLDGRARDVVSWAAAIGRRFDAGILGRASEMPAGDMLAALEKLEARAIIRPAEGGASYDFTHDLIREAAYQAISGPRRLLVHRHVAGALQSAHDPDASLAGEIMRHAAIAGDHDLAVRYAIEAGRRCLRLFAYAGAQEVVRLGLQLAETLPDRARIEGEVALLEVVVMCRIPVAQRREYGPRITDMIERAHMFGIPGAAAVGAHLLATLHAESDDLGGAAAQTVRSAEISRGGDPRMTAYTMAGTARCLVLIERDIPRAQARSPKSKRSSTPSAAITSKSPSALATCTRIAVRTNARSRISSEPCRWPPAYRTTRANGQPECGW